MNLPILQSEVKTMSSDKLDPIDSEHCCPESDKNYEAQAHIIDAQDEHHHDEADAHVFMLNGLLVAKDVPMPKAGV